MGVAASAICSADCAAKLDQARRLKVGGSEVPIVACMAEPFRLSVQHLGRLAARRTPPLAVEFAIRRAGQN